METVTLLGTAGAMTSGDRDNVSLVFRSGSYHVLIECGGSAAHKLANIAQKAQVKQLVLAHLDMVLHDDPQEIVTEVRQNLDGPVVVASDFDTF